MEANDENIPKIFLKYEDQLSKELNNLTFSSPAHYIYNPLEYAWKPHSTFVKTYCKGTKDVLFLRINPGPWGMCQTGIPFGEVNISKEWLKMNGEVEKPKNECPKKQIKGFECHRSEQSGKRFYGFFKNLCRTPEVFFKNAFVYNFCPLSFMEKEEEGKRCANITPDKLKGQIKKDLENICGKTLVNILKLLDVKIIVAVGRYTEKQAVKIIQESQLDIEVIYMRHPSRMAGRNWSKTAQNVLDTTDLKQYFSNNN
ncbi:single-strand selective monofunctional uracil DNA glycosylase-like [Onthophagus taurus]|uniref:single-strand selective monofunctional uracil DNA glycosylase-like n=1 Tax=Onthophagus taurus TaxID=166361 RepID=UPI0039BE9AF7